MCAGFGTTAWSGPHIAALAATMEGNQPAPCAAIIPAPSADASMTWRRHTGWPVASATICTHSRLRAPPPITTICSIDTPAAAIAAMPRANSSVSPSVIERNICARPCELLSPTKQPVASESQCGSMQPDQVGSVSSPSAPIGMAAASASSSDRLLAPLRPAMPRTSQSSRKVPVRCTVSST